MSKTRVVVVDDSALVRSLLTEIINRQPDMTCIGSAADPYAAREMIRNLNPDVITLDVEMPRMVGIVFLSMSKKVNHPVPSTDELKAEVETRVSLAADAALEKVNALLSVPGAAVTVAERVLAVPTEVTKRFRGKS